MFFSSKNLELKEKTYNAPDLRLEGYLVFFFYLVHISDPLLIFIFLAYSETKDAKKSLVILICEYRLDFLLCCK